MESMLEMYVMHVLCGGTILKKAQTTSMLHAASSAVQSELTGLPMEK